MVFHVQRPYHTCRLRDRQRELAGNVLQLSATREVVTAAMVTVLAGRWYLVLWGFLQIGIVFGSAFLSSLDRRRFGAL